MPLGRAFAVWRVESGLKLARVQRGHDGTSRAVRAAHFHKALVIRRWLRGVSVKIETTRRLARATFSWCATTVRRALNSWLNYAAAARYRQALRLHATRTAKRRAFNVWRAARLWRALSLIHI